MKRNNSYHRSQYNQNRYNRKPKNVSIFSYLIPFLLIGGIILVGFNFLKNGLDEGSVLKNTDQEEKEVKTGVVLNDVLGEVSLLSEGNAQASGAFNKLELKEGDQLESGQGVFMINFFDSFVVRANQGTTLDILSLDLEKKMVTLKLHQGELWGRILNYSDSKSARFNLITKNLGIEVKEAVFAVKVVGNQNPQVKVLDGKVNLSIYEEADFKEPLASTLVTKTSVSKDQKTEINPADFPAIKKKSKMLELRIIEQTEKEEDQWYLKNMQADQKFLTLIKEKSKLNIEKLKENESWLEILIGSETADEIEKEKLIYYKAVGVLRDFPEIEFIAEENNDSLGVWEKIETETGVLREGEQVVSTDNKTTEVISEFDLFEYQVQAGDGLVALAEKFEVEWELLAKINKLEYPYDLVLGQKLFIPNKKGINTELTFTKEKKKKEKEIIKEENEKEVLPPVSNYIRYTVSSGDSLSKIAFKYGLDWQEIVKVNYIEAPYALSIGQEIIIPIEKDSLKLEKEKAEKIIETKYKDLSTFDYQVQPGENLGIIARKFNVEMEAIISLSKLEDENYLIVGQNLKIPQTGSGAIQ